MQPNRVIDLFMDLPPPFDIVRRKPATYAFVLQVGMEPLGKLLVARRVADEAGVVLDGPSHHRAIVALVGWLSAALRRLFPFVITRGRTEVPREAPYLRFVG